MATHQALPGRDAAENGFTLVELLVYMVLAVVVLLIVGGVLINTLTTERTVRDATQASNTGQLVAKSVGHGVRNASDIWLSAPGVVPELLMVRTVGSDATPNWFCQAWSYDSGEVRTSTSTEAIMTGQTSSTVTSWTLLADGVEPVVESAVAQPVFGVSGRQVTLNLDVSTGDGQPVLISTVSTSRQPVSVTGVVPTCFP